jgi:CTP:molybdopterin cytidylyltransferase MocA
MGRPKPLLDFDGKTCLDLVVTAGRKAGCTPIVLVLGADAERIRAGCREVEGTIVVINDRPERGQTSSVKAGLAALPAEIGPFFVLPADHPLVEAGTFQALDRALGGSDPDRSIAIPTHEGRRGHPVLFGAGHRPGVLALDDADPLRGYIRAREADVALVAAADPGIIMGMNTDEEYRVALSAYRRGGARPE